MLDRFKVPKEDEVKVSESALRKTVQEIFAKTGLSKEDSQNGAEVLVTADLRGVESHGVSNMLRIYVQLFEQGDLNKTPNLTVIKETTGTATIDADRALGIMAGVPAMERAISKARNVGVGIVTMFNSGHMGAVGHFSMMAAQQDMVGMCSVAAGTGILPTFGAEPKLGTNPISIASPSNLEAPILFDAATSAVAGNKLRLAARVDATLLPGWVASSDGSPIMEETKIVNRDDYHQLPLGGSREQGSHKGYGFGLMVEILGSLLSGDDPGMLRDTPSWTPSRTYFAAYNVEAFTDVNVYKKNMDDMLSTLKNTPPAPGHERVLYPGLSESEEMAKRKETGIPLHKEVIEWFSSTTKRLGLEEMELL